MIPVDPCVDPRLVPAGSKPILIARDQPEYNTLPSVITPSHVVITRWTLSEEERVAIVAGADIFVTIWGTPIRPMLPSVGPINWTQE